MAQIAQGPYAFSTCCDTHDRAYGTCHGDALGAGKTAADNALYSCMIDRCEHSYPGTSSIGESIWEWYCKKAATKIIYAAVNLGGESAYQTAQGMACTCVTPPPSPTALPSTPPSAPPSPCMSAPPAAMIVQGPTIDRQGQREADELTDPPDGGSSDCDRCNDDPFTCPEALAFVAAEGPPTGTLADPDLVSPVPLPSSDDDSDTCPAGL